MPTSNKSPVLRPKTVCSELGISLSTLWRIIARGDLKTIKISPRCTGIRRTDLDTYLNQNS
jgi:hypothetical protein